MTFDQIEDIRRSGEPCVSLREATLSVGLPFVQCTRCKGSGFTSAMLLETPRLIEILAKAGCRDPVAIQYDRCPECGGSGGFVGDLGREEAVL